MIKHYYLKMLPSQLWATLIMVLGPDWVSFKIVVYFSSTVGNKHCMALILQSIWDALISSSQKIRFFRLHDLPSNTKTENLSTSKKHSKTNPYTTSHVLALFEKRNVSYALVCIEAGHFKTQHAGFDISNPNHRF